MLKNVISSCRKVISFLIPVPTLDKTKLSLVLSTQQSRSKLMERSMTAPSYYNVHPLGKRPRQSVASPHCLRARTKILYQYLCHNQMVRLYVNSEHSKTDGLEV